MYKNFFALLNIPVGFELDLKVLDRNYFILQTEFHPDKLPNNEEINEVNNLLTSARINEAYTTLKSPILRAAYLLKLQDIDVEQEIQTINNIELLEQSLEDREALQAIDDIKELVKFEELILDRQSIVIQNYSASYQTGEFNKALTTYIKLKYIVKLLDEISNKKRLMDNEIINNK